MWRCKTDPISGLLLTLIDQLDPACALFAIGSAFGNAAIERGKFAPMLLRQRQQISIHACPSAFVTRPGERIKSSLLARWQAAQGFARVTTLRHERVSIDANMGRLLQLLDGIREGKAIHRAATDWALAETNGIR